MLYPEYVDTLEDFEPGCSEGGNECDMKAALRWLISKQEPYQNGVFTPPMEAKNGPLKYPRLAAFTVRVRRQKILSSATMVGRLDFVSQDSGHTSLQTLERPDATSISKTMLTSSFAGYLILTTGHKRNVLDIFLEQFGPGLCDLGYTIQPCISGSRVAFLTVRKGKRKWTLGYAEVASGVPSSTMLDFAMAAKPSLAGLHSRGGARALYSAIVAYQAFLAEHFGVAINPTAGMTAMQAVRRDLPEEYRKWRPTPLLVSMERWGRGYRGGMTHAARYKGRSWRIDVNRQYTNALAAPLPYRSAFGRYVSESETPHGVFLCHVRIRNGYTYPLGVWRGPSAGFISETVGTGTYVSVLHTAEFYGLRRAGAEISPGYGYVFTHCYSFAPYVERLQHILDIYGYDSPAGKLTKPLGNYVYGKLGQNPHRKELMFSEEKPEDSSWIPYMDDELRFWPRVWERDVRKVTSTQHVDMAGTITGAARSQTISMWAALREAGANVVRCHTDSLTVDRDPRQLDGIADSIDPGIIGTWKLESAYEDTIIAGVNAFIDEKGAHMAGVHAPDWETIERIYDGHVTYVVQKENAPLRGFSRGAREVRRKYG